MSIEEVVLQVKMINNLIYNTRDSNIRQFLLDEKDSLLSVYCENLKNKRKYYEEYIPSSTEYAH